MSGSQKLNTVRIRIVIILLIGILLRFYVSMRGHNFDFESYQIVGEIVSNGENVYEKTNRYNYTPIFSLFLGLFYSISSLFRSNNVLVFRVLIISFLSVFDILTFFFLLRKYSINKAAIFFLYPTAIIITGFHNQFDNIAIFFALLATGYYSESKSFEKKDYAFIFFLALSLSVKHLLFCFPIWLFMRKNLSWTKRFVFMITPVVLFLCSFLPYLKTGWHGILNNVFFYRSANNFPLLYSFLQSINFPKNGYFLLFLFCMILFGFLFRRRTILDSLLLYFLSLTAFSSAIANQYLVIPVIGLIVFSNYSKWLYGLIAFVYLCTDLDGMHLGLRYTSTSTVLSTILSRGIVFPILMFILLLVILKEAGVFSEKINRII